MISEFDTQPQPSCEDEIQTGLLSVEAALEKILLMIEPIVKTELVPVQESLGRVLAEDLFSPIDVPNHTNAAMDGYAVHSSDLEKQKLCVIGTAWAGRPFNEALKPGECIRIMTGAVMPENSDTVIMQENVKRKDNIIYVASEQRPGQHVRQAGEDLNIGSLALSAGRRLFPAELGVIASLGIADVPVIEKPKVAFFSNGDELRSINETLDVGEVYDSKRYTLNAMLTRAEANIIDLGVVPHNPKRLEETFQQAAANAYLVITSAGASVGDAEYVLDILKKIGEVKFWKIAMKPGRPLSVGKIGPSAFFGLPGNPVSVMVTFYQFVLPALRKLSGEKNIAKFRCSARLTRNLKKRRGRTEFQRGILKLGDDGTLIVENTGEQGSGILTSMNQANCFVILPAESEGADVGDIVTVEPFAGLI